jgi:hypothetical protein
MCEDLTDIATALDHIAETVDYIQYHFTGKESHEYPIPTQKVHPDGTHPSK